MYREHAYANALTSCFRRLLRQGRLRTKPRGDGSPYWVAFYRGVGLPGSCDIHIFEVLRHSFVPAPFVVWRRDQL